MKKKVSNKIINRLGESNIFRRKIDFPKQIITFLRKCHKIQHKTLVILNCFFEKYVLFLSNMFDIFGMLEINLCIFGVFCIINCYFYAFIGFCVIFCIYIYIYIYYFKCILNIFGKMSRSVNNFRTTYWGRMF